MKNIKVSLKLIVSFLLMVSLSLIIGIVGIYGIRTLDTVSVDTYENKARPLGDLTLSTEYFQRLRVQARNIVLFADDANQLKSIEADIRLRLSQFVASMGVFEPTITTENGQMLYNTIMKHFGDTFEPSILKMVEAAKQGLRGDELVEIMLTSGEAADAISNAIDELTQARIDVMKVANEESTQLGNTLLAAIVIVLVVAVILSVLLAVYISGLIAKPLSFMVGALDQIARKGDLELDPKSRESAAECETRKDEIGSAARSVGELIQHFKEIEHDLQMLAEGNLSIHVKTLSERDTIGLSVAKVVESLNGMFNEINSSTSQVSAGSKQIAEGSQALAQGSAEQAAAVEELSSSIAEIAEKTKVNAQMASTAANLANTIKGSAEKGNAQMNQMMEAVKDINQASQSISKIIKVIDDIAFQTNILALNAAVEAARAGQHGKGFAVVAEEVRNLAAKSAEAAKETGSMIANSIEKAELGSRIAGDTATSLQEIVSGINESSRIVEEIARSSEEQTEGIVEINKGIDQVAQVVQQNSANAEESAASSEEMSGQAEVLEALIAHFKRKDTDISVLGTAAAGQSGKSKTFQMPDRGSGEPVSGGANGKY